MSLEESDSPVAPVRAREQPVSGVQEGDQADTSSAASGSASAVVEEPKVVSPPASNVATGDAAETELMTIVKKGLIDLVDKFPYNEGDDAAKKSAATFIKALNDNLNPSAPAAAVAPAPKGGSRRALKRIMKKYSRRVNRSRRQRGNRVKPLAQ
jgi:hypothetical protein